MLSEDPSALAGGSRAAFLRATLGSAAALAVVVAQPKEAPAFGEEGVCGWRCNATNPSHRSLKKCQDPSSYVHAHHSTSRETKQCSRNRYAELARDAAFCCCRSWMVEGIPYKTPSDSQERESERTHLWCPMCPLYVHPCLCQFALVSPGHAAVIPLIQPPTVRALRQGV